MNWRRGIVFAVIHALIVLVFIVTDESRDWPTARISKYVDNDVQRVAWQEDQGLGFDPCSGGYIDGISQAERVVTFANFPVMGITGWPSACPQRSLAAKFAEKALHTKGRETQSAVHVIVETIVMVEWLLIGGFPFVRRSRWWPEPGALITICTIAGFALAMIPLFTRLTAVPCVGAFVGWLWWFGALLLKGVRAVRAHQLARA